MLNNKYIKVNNQEDKNKFLKWCYENQIYWVSGERVYLDDKVIETLGSEGCYNVENFDTPNVQMYHCTEEFYLEKGYKQVSIDKLPIIDKSTPKVSIVRINGSNEDIVNRCRTTVGKGIRKLNPSDNFMKKLYLSEHSPIRLKHFIVRIENIPSWVATHFVRHKIGAEHFVQTQRDDRTNSNIPRGEIPQGALVTMEMELNPQSVISISKKRLCRKASKETRNIWSKVVDEINKYDSALYECCVPECVYRGFCPETSSCGYSDTENFEINLDIYRNN